MLEHTEVCDSKFGACSAQKGANPFGAKAFGAHRTENSTVMARIAFRILFNVTRRTKDRKYICSELVYECFHHIGVPCRLPNEFVSPDDIWKDDQVQPRFRIM